MCSKHRRKESQKSPAFWESMVNKYEGRNCELEEKECEVQNRLEMLQKTAPQMVFLNMWRLMQKEHGHPPRRNRSKESFSKNKERNFCRGDSRDRSRSRSPLQTTIRSEKNKNPTNSESKLALKQYIHTLEEDKDQLTRQKNHMENMIKDLEMQMLEIKNTQTQQNTFNCGNNEDDAVSICSLEFDLMRNVKELKERGAEMSKRIEMLEKRETAYLETLKQADEICAEMEIGYRQHCYLAEQNEAKMRDRLQRLKKRDEFERRCCYGDTILQRDKKQDHRESSKYWSMLEPFCSMLNRWY